MAQVTIRPETRGDHQAVYEVHASAFGQPDEARLVEALRESPAFIPELSLVALRDGRVVGHILLSPITIRAASEPIAALALAPMGVLPEHQNRGVGSQLVRHGLEACRRLGHRLVVVIGHPDYYPRFGFRPASRRGLQAPFEVPDAAFLLWEATPDDSKDIAGRVEFPPAFDGL